MNSISITGRLTRDPELRLVGDGKSICKLRLAVERMGRNNDTGYVDVTCFGKPAEAAAKILSRGWLVAVEGRLQYSEWETDSGKRSGHSIVGHVEFLGAPKSTAAPAPAPVDIAA